MKKSKGMPDLMTIVGIGLGVAAGVWAINRFTDGGLSTFGRPPAPNQSR